jgi:transposase InsO family protein
MKVVHKKWLGIDLSQPNQDTSNQEIAHYREKVILHYDKYGLASCLDAFGVSKSTLFRWKKKYTQGYQELVSLIPRSTTRKNQNSRWTHPEILKIIQRERFGQVVGKAKLFHIISVRCKELGIPSISQSTIGRILSNMKHNKQIPSYKTVTYYAVSGKICKKDRKQQKKDRRGEYVPTSPGDLAQIDTVENRINGLKRYTIDVIDVYTRLTYSKVFTNLNSKNAMTTLIEAQEYFGFTFKHVQTDNGLEFYKYFDDYLITKNIQHFWNYPKSPKMNAYIERFNRTIQEELLYRIRPLLKYQVDYVNTVVMPKYRDYYNKQRLHQSLDYNTPYQYYLDYQSKSAK